MTVKIGHAHSNENNKAKGGVAGDQTGREILIQNWYRRTEGWTAVFRAKDGKTAEKIARAMEQACANEKIGYDQGQRTTLYNEAMAVGWDLSKITATCECDCSSLVAVCTNAAGISIRKSMHTGNQKAILSSTGKFEILSDTKYLTTPNYLMRGDILLGPGHTAIVLTDGNNTNSLENNKIDSAKSFSQSLAGSYKVTASKLNIRRGAGILKKILVTVPKGTTVKCYGYYSKILDIKWLYVQFSYKGVTYTGFASSKYLIK